MQCADELESEYIGLELESPSYFIIFAALQHFETVRLWILLF